MRPTDVSADDWDRHWDEYNRAVETNPAQRYRRGLVISLLGLGAGPARVLDIGSGQGDLAAELSRQFPDAQIVGLELSRSGCEISREKVPGATFVQCDLLEVAEPPPELRGWATHAVCSEVLEHLVEPETLLRNVRPFLGPGCVLIVTVPGGPMSAFDKHIGHRRHYRRRSLTSLLESAGFRVESTLGAGFPFHNLYRLAVILRGRRLVEDATASEDLSSSRMARMASWAFGALFRLNATSSPWGWQLVATARAPG